MTMHMKDSGGTWRTIGEVHVRVSGVWQAVSEGWVRVSGVWQQFYSTVVTATLTNASVADSDPLNSRTVTATITIGSDGNVYKTENTTTTQINTSTDWLRPTSGASGYYVRFTKSFFGTTPSVGASLEGVWSALTLNREYGYQHNLSNTTQSDFAATIEIATDAAGTNIVASGTFNLSAARGA